MTFDRVLSLFGGCLKKNYGLHIFQNDGIYYVLIPEAGESRGEYYAVKTPDRLLDILASEWEINWDIEHDVNNLTNEEELEYQRQKREAYQKFISSLLQDEHSRMFFSQK